MSKFVGIIIGVILVAVGVATGNPYLIVQGSAMIVTQAVVLLTAPKTPARQASEMSIALGEQPRCAQFGETYTPGSLVDGFNYGGKYGTQWEVLVIRLADHKCEGLTGFYVNDEYNEYKGNGYYPKYGTDNLQLFFRADTTNEPLPSIVTDHGPGWTASDIGESGCDVIVAYKADKPDTTHPVWPGGRPRFGFILKGKLCYDPRKDSTVVGGSGSHRWDDPDTWEWTDNCVICRYNWVRGIYANDDVTDPTALLIGRGLSEEEAPPQNIFAAANLCEVDAASTHPYQQVATTAGGEFAFGGGYLAYWSNSGDETEWYDVRTRSRLGTSSSPAAAVSGIGNYSLADDGTAYAYASYLGYLGYIVTEPLGTPTVTTVASAASVVAQVTRALQTIDGLQVFGAYGLGLGSPTGYLKDGAHVALSGKLARDFCLDGDGHPWMLSHPSGSSAAFTLTDLKTGVATTLTGTVTRSAPTVAYVAYTADTDNFLVNTDGRFYIIDKATMTVTSSGVTGWSGPYPNTQQDASRISFWVSASEYSLATGALLRTVDPSDWLSESATSYAYDNINHAIWSRPGGGHLTIRFLDRSGPWRVAGPVYSNQEFLEVEEMFAAACAGNVITREGSVELEPAQAKSIVATFTDDDLLVGSGIKWNRGFLSRSSDEWVNSVSARYIEPDQKWNDHEAPVMRNTADIIADGKPREATLTLRLVRYQAQAMRIAEIARRLGRVWGRATVTLPPRFCYIEDGDWVQWQSERRFAGGTKTFRVDAYQIDEKWWNTLTLREINAGVFADDAVYPVDQSIPTKTPPPPDIGTPDAGNWTLTPVTLDGPTFAIPALRVEGSANDDEFAERIIVEYWLDDGAGDPVADPDSVAWTSAGSFTANTTTVDITSITAGATYYAAVSYIVDGITGDRLVLGPVTVSDFFNPNIELEDGSTLYLEDGATALTLG